ncbi:glycosyltransferase [Sutcliffiella horikoshii]|uniref:Glycosyltransferase n=1 Tax=Sutcliffiella horikoshii TaxID=79883 RepID=A0AA95B761_9BACI|nr:glycosyltransferase [Sutcliffiella horikoshii]TYS60081.1 glycosyltransferase [Sutcliffiella horikoshii]
MRTEISIIVPIYNVERYLPTCIESIYNQSFQDYELILVNDGSFDNSAEICMEYAEKDNRIKIVNKKNGGLSSARNAGVQEASGKYIIFVDPDDKLSENYLNKLYSTAEKNNCCVVVSGYQTIPDLEKRKPGFQLNKVLSGKKFILSSQKVHSNNDLCFVWRYIYKRSVLEGNNIRFNEEVFIGEDVIFNLSCLLKASRVVAIPDTLYQYTINNPESLMKISYKPKLESSLLVQYRIRKQLSLDSGLLEYHSYRKDMATYYVTSIYQLMKENAKNNHDLNMERDIKRIINYEMIRESLNELKFHFPVHNLKQFIYYLALKYRVYSLISRVHKKEVG